MSGLGLGRVKTPTFNLRVEIPSRFRKFENQKCLRPPLREDDRENNSAHSWLVHGFTQPGSTGAILSRSRCLPLFPQERTSIWHVCSAQTFCRPTAMECQEAPRRPRKGAANG